MIHDSKQNIRNPAWTNTKLACEHDLSTAVWQRNLEHSHSSSLCTTNGLMQLEVLHHYTTRMMNFTKCILTPVQILSAMCFGRVSLQTVFEQTVLWKMTNWDEEIS